MLLEDLEYGGTQRQTLELASRLNRERFEPRLVTLRRGPMDLEGEARSLGLSCRVLTDRDSFEPLAVLPALWRYLRRDRPPLLHLLTALPNIWGRVLGRPLRLPGIIASCRGLASVRNQHERRLGKMARVHICNAEAIREQLVNSVGLPAERVIHIPNGVNVDFFSPAETERDEPALLCVARMAKVKNHPMLLRAFAEVLASFPEASLHLLGEGGGKDAIRELASAPDLRGRVVMHPGSQDVRPYLHMAQIFVLSSDFEGTPNALLEAMSCGLPVIATRTGGNAEAVQHEKNGLLVPCGDAGAMARAMLRLLNRPGERIEFGRAGRESVVNHYSMRAMVRAHEAVYEHVLGMK